MDADLPGPDAPLPDDVPALQALVRQLLAEVARLRADNARLSAENAELKGKLDSALKHRFGRRSERGPGGEVQWADVEVLHTGYADPALRARKLQRDLRLLEMEFREQPHDPFTLFNLGATYQEMGRSALALPLLQESLARSHSRDSIVRKLYSLIALALLHLGRPEEGLKVCLDGQRVCPDDAELLFLEGAVRTDLGDLHGAKAALLRLLGGQPGQHFASVAEGLRGHRGRHQLAVVCAKLGERQDAEGLWLAALRESPGSLPAWQGLAGLYLDWGREADFAGAVAQIGGLPGGAPEAAWWRVRALFVGRRLAEARSSVERAILRWPDDVPLLLLCSHVLLEQGGPGAEAAVEAVLKRDANNANAKHNLAALRARRLPPG